MLTAGYVNIYNSHGNLGPQKSGKNTNGCTSHPLKMEICHSNEMSKLGDYVT